MAFSSEESKQIEKVVGGMCERRSPAAFHQELRLSYSVKGHEVLILEGRPGWRDPSGWFDMEIAKLRFVRSANEWRLYWKRASGKWWPYEPASRKRLSSLVEHIERDEYGCFFG
jgi:hypothetical protein